MEDYKKKIKDEITRLEKLQKELGEKIQSGNTHLTKMSNDFQGINYQLGSLRELIAEPTPKEDKK